MSNPRIPTYDKSVGLQVTEQPNPAGSAEMMINSFRNFSETTASITQGISKEVATQQRETLKNNISNTYRQFSLDALRNPDQNAGLADYTAKSKQYAAGLMQQTDRFNRPYVSNLVDYYHNEHQYSIEKNAIEQNQRSLSVEAYKNMNDATRDWEDAINNSKPMVDEKGEDAQFTTSRALFADQLRSMEKYAKLKFIDPATLGNARNELIKKYQTSEYLKRYQDHVEQGAGNQFISQMQKPNFHIPGMNDQEKYQVVNQMIKLRDQGKRGAHVAIGQLQYQMSDDIINVKNGGMVNQDLLSQVNALDPIRGEQYKDQLDVAQSQWSAKQAVQFKSPEEKADYKKSLYDIDYNTPDAAKQRKIADASMKAIDEQDKEMNANPLAFVMKNPAIQNAVNSYEQAYNADAVGEPHKYTPVNSTVPKPWDSVIQEQMHLGMTINGKNEKAVRLLDPSRVNTMINEVMQSSPQDKVIWMNKLSDEFGGGMPFKLALKQLISAGLPRNYALLASIDPNSPDAARVAESVSIPAADIAKELHSKQKDAPSYIGNRSINDVFGTGSSGTNNFNAFLSTIPQYSDSSNIEFKKNMSSDISQIANYYALTQHMSADEATSKAEDIIANRYTYTSMNNKMVRLPNQVSADAVKSYANKMQADLSQFNFNMEGVDRARAERSIQYGHWANDSIDDGLVWVDSSGKMWTDANGHPYSFTFRDAEVGMPHVNIPVTKKSMQPQTEQNVDQGTQPSDPDLDAIDRAGQAKLDYLKKHGSSYSRLMKSAQDKK